MKSTKSGRTIRLPCCDKDVRLTARKSKLQERPRNHKCPECGRKYHLSVAGDKVKMVLVA